MNILLIICIVLLSLSGPATAQINTNSDFKVVLTKHLKGISERNLSDIVATVDDSVTLVFPDGEILKSKQKFIDFHKEWFRDLRWQMTTEIISTTESKKLSYGLVQYHLFKFNEDGTVKEKSTAYLLLIFKRQRDGWKLLHDQNTKLESDEK